MLRLDLEEGVSDTQVVKDTEFKQLLSILIHFPHSKPRQEGHESLSAPTLALKSPRRTSCSVLGMFLMVDARFS